MSRSRLEILQKPRCRSRSSGLPPHIMADRLKVFPSSRSAAMSPFRQVAGSCLFVLCLLFALSPALAQDAQGGEKSKKDKLNVAIIVHEGVELLDFAGPGEVFQAAAQGRAFKVYTVGDSTRPITSQQFLKVMPNHAIVDC